MKKKSKDTFQNNLFGSSTPTMKTTTPRDDENLKPSNPTPYLDVTKLAIGSGRPHTPPSFQNVQNVKHASSMKTVEAKKTLKSQEKLPVHNIIAPPVILSSKNNSSSNVEVPKVSQSSKPVINKQAYNRDEEEKAKVNQKKYQDERKLKLEIFLKTEAEKKGKEKKQLDELKGYYVVWSTQRDFTDQDLQKRVDHLELYLLRAKEIGLKKIVRKSCQKGVSQEILNELWKGATELRKLIKNPTQYSPQIVQC